MPDQDSEQSFDQLLSEFERTHSRAPQGQINATVVSLTTDLVLLDIGQKVEGSLPLSDFPKPPAAGDVIPVTVKGRDPETGLYSLSRFKVAMPTDWDALEKAFNEKTSIVGTVTAAVKGGLSVDVGVRAFMPASRTGTRDAAEMAKLVGQEIRCRITKLDVADEDVVVDRRIVLEEEENLNRDRLLSQLKEGDTVSGTVRSFADYGAFVDIGGVDGLLHVGEIAWNRIAKPSDVLTIGEPVQVRIVKIDPATRRISLSLRQLQANPWDAIAQKYKPGQRISGTVTRVADFGAFVELEPGVEGLIHVSELSWGKKIKIASEFLKPGETVETEILKVEPDTKRISLSLKQTLGDPWANVASRFAAGTQVQGTITRLAPFGAFLQIEEGVEGLIHISEITSERRINHPQEVLKVGEVVKAMVLAVDPEKRQFKLSIKQLEPTSIDEYIAERKVGETVSGRVIEVSGETARVELGEGVVGTATVAAAAQESSEAKSPKADLSSLSQMLNAKWKGAAGSTATSKKEPLRSGQVRSFRITGIEPESKKITLALA